MAIGTARFGGKSTSILPTKGVCADDNPQQVADSWLRTHLRSLSPPLRGDTVHVPPPASDSVRPAGAIDSAYFAPFRQFYGSNIGELAVLTRWDKAGEYEMFLLRVPGDMNWVGAQVWTYDLHHCSWDRGPMIADQGGDAGDHVLVHGWIVDLDHDGHLDLIRREKLWSLADDDAETPPKLSQDKVTVYYWNTRNTYFAETYVPNDVPLRRAFDFKYHIK